MRSEGYFVEASQLQAARLFGVVGALGVWGFSGWGSRISALDLRGSVGLHRRSGNLASRAVSTVTNPINKCKKPQLTYLQELSELTHVAGERRGC